MIKIIKNIFFLSLFFLFINCDSSSQSKDNSNNIVVVKVFSSLTCPHCAVFHKKVYEELDKEYISIGKVKFEHHSFPLDLAALNAEKILQCKANSQTNFKLLSKVAYYNVLVVDKFGTSSKKLNTWKKNLEQNSIDCVLYVAQRNDFLKGETSKFKKIN